MPVSAQEVRERIKEKNEAKLEQAIEIIDSKLDGLDDYKIFVLFDNDDVEGIKMDIKTTYTKIGWNVEFCANNDNTTTFEFWIE
jgi:hypothetical protein